jgi:hypothetical protein
MDHGFARDAEPWEFSDGIIYLIREMSLTGEKASELVLDNLQSMADLGYVDHFRHSHTLKENLFKSLKEMITNKEGLGKKKYRPVIEVFFEPAFRVADQGESQATNSLNCALSA